MNNLNWYELKFESGLTHNGLDARLFGRVSPYQVGCAFERWGARGRRAGLRRRLAGPWP
jgi:hypothetical protein